MALFERGPHNDHDGIKVALITSLNSDIEKKPNGYHSTIITVNKTHYNYGNNRNEVLSNRNFQVVRTDNTLSSLKATQRIDAQGIGGVYISFEDFDVDSGTTIYGYSLVAMDFPSTSIASSLLDYTNSSNFPNNTSESIGGIDLTAVLGFVKVVEVKGNVFYTPKGYSITTATTDIHKVLDTLMSDKLYVNVIKGTTVIEAKEVNRDGTFKLDNLVLGSDVYIQLTKNLGTVGSSKPLTELPEGWGYVGENKGITTNEVGDYLHLGFINNNGHIPVNINDFSINNLNFGIQKKPETQNLSKLISTPSVNDILYFNDINLPKLSGKDYEDTDDIITDLTGMKVMFSNLESLDGNELYYDGELIIENQIIASLDPNKLYIKFIETGSKKASFQYSVFDAFGLQSEPSSYLISWYALANNSIIINGYKDKHNNFISWSLPNDKQWEELALQYSHDGQHYNTILDIAKSNINHYVDNQVGETFYRIMAMDNNSQILYSKVLFIGRNAIENKISIAPNPASDHVIINSTYVIKQITIIDIQGNVVIDEKINNDHCLINIQSLIPGIYNMQVVSGYENLKIIPFIKK